MLELDFHIQDKMRNKSTLNRILSILINLGIKIVKIKTQKPVIKLDFFSFYFSMKLSTKVNGFLLLNQEKNFWPTLYNAYSAYNNAAHDCSSANFSALAITSSRLPII